MPTEKSDKSPTPPDQTIRPDAAPVPDSRPKTEDEKLDEALKESFPSSDPVSITPER